jgi:hypothetical protein
MAKLVPPSGAPFPYKESLTRPQLNNQRNDYDLCPSDPRMWSQRGLAKRGAKREPLRFIMLMRRAAENKDV